MSIPSVRFKAPPRKPGLQRGPPNSKPPINTASSNYHRPNDRIVSIDFSSDESDDLPVIQTSQKVKHTLIEIDASSDEDNGDQNDSNSDFEAKEVDWGSKNAKPVNFMPRQTSRTSSSGSGNPIRGRQYKSASGNANNIINQNNNQQNYSQESSENQQYSSNNQQTVSDSTNNGQNAQNAQHRRRRRPRKPQQGVQQSTISKQNIILHNSEEDDDEIGDDGEIVVQRPNLNGQQHQAQQNQIQFLSSSSTTTTTTTTTTTNGNNGNNGNGNGTRFARSRTLDTFNGGPKNDTTSDQSMQTFVVVREKKTGKKIQADFRMMQNEAAIFFSKVHKDEIGISYLISKVMPVVVGSSDIFGLLRKQDHGKRFTVYTTDEKYNDDRDPEAIGMSFVKLPEIKSKQRTFRLAFRVDGGINYPISKRRELSRIAENGDVHPEIKSLVNKPPVIGPDGNLINFFGSMYVVDSLKNYIVCDEKDEPIFMIFKSSEASFTVKAKFPITPLMAFGLSIAIIEDCR